MRTTGSYALAATMMCAVACSTPLDDPPAGASTNLENADDPLFAYYGTVVYHAGNSNETDYIPDTYAWTDLQFEGDPPLLTDETAVVIRLDVLTARQPQAVYGSRLQDFGNLDPNNRRPDMPNGQAMTPGSQIQVRSAYDDPDGAGTVGRLWLQLPGEDTWASEVRAWVEFTWVRTPEQTAVGDLGDPCTYDTECLPALACVSPTDAFGTPEEPAASCQQP
jgi:hypothetical protein